MVAADPLGPWSYRGDINRRAADPRRVRSGNGDAPPGAGRADATIPMQIRSHACLPTPQGEAIILRGDRWESRPDGLKGHDLTYVTSPLAFQDDGMIGQPRWEDQWSLEVSPGRARSCRAAARHAG